MNKMVKNSGSAHLVRFWFISLLYLLLKPDLQVINEKHVIPLVFNPQPECAVFLIDPGRDIEPVVYPAPPVLQPYKFIYLK